MWDEDFVPVKRNTDAVIEILPVLRPKPIRGLRKIFFQKRVLPRTEPNFSPRGVVADRQHGRKEIEETKKVLSEASSSHQVTNDNHEGKEQPTKQPDENATGFMWIKDPGPDVQPFRFEGILPPPKKKKYWNRKLGCYTKKKEKTNKESCSQVSKIQVRKQGEYESCLLGVEPVSIVEPKKEYSEIKEECYFQSQEMDKGDKIYLSSGPDLIEPNTEHSDLESDDTSFYFDTNLQHCPSIIPFAIERNAECSDTVLPSVIDTNMECPTPAVTKQTRKEKMMRRRERQARKGNQLPSEWRRSHKKRYFVKVSNLDYLDG